MDTGTVRPVETILHSDGLSCPDFQPLTLLKRTATHCKPFHNTLKGQSLFTSASLVPRLLLKKTISLESHWFVHVWLELWDGEAQLTHVPYILKYSDAGHCHRGLIIKRQTSRYLVGMSGVPSVVSKTT